MAWYACGVLCSPKASEGLGFRKAKNFNDALLAKLVWMVSNRDSPCMIALEASIKLEVIGYLEIRQKILHALGELFRGSNLSLVKGRASLLVMEKMWTAGRILGSLGCQILFLSQGMGRSLQILF